MPKASEVALELRKVADALYKEPDMEVAKVMVTFFCSSWAVKNKKQSFMNLVRLLPRPLKKTLNDHEYLLENEDQSVIWLQCRIDRSEVCTLIAPAKEAKWSCELLLSDDEEASLTEV